MPKPIKQPSKKYPWEQKGEGYESAFRVWNRLGAKKYDQGLTPEETSLMEAAYEATDVGLLADLQM